ncbi:MAG: fused response regulator/phosphatase [Planctomycetota bacterium]
MTAPRILVVDDEPAMLRATERVLGDRYRVRTARTAAEATEAMQEDSADLAIIDVRMPETDGFQVSGLLRELREDLDVIFMTGVIQQLDAQLVRSIREKAFYFIQKPFDRDVLLTIVHRCFEQRRLAAENRRYVTRLEQELRQARSFQRSLLPPAQARLEGLELHARYLPSDALGGDLYDFVRGGEGLTTVLVADVSGHGVSAAMLTGIVKAALHSAGDSGYRPTDVISRIADGMRSFDDARFVSAFVGRFSRADRTLEYVNAGHPAGLLWVPRGPWRLLDLTGPLISPAFPDLRRDVQKVHLRDDERMLLYTDGVTETPRDRDGELFGDERLRELLVASEQKGGALLDEVLTGLNEFAAGRPAEDDRTLLVAGYP